MKILILAAMDKEINLLVNILQNENEIELNGFKIWTGNVKTHSIFISKCGIGKVNSALNTLSLIQQIKPDLVINSGVAGGAGCPIGSVIIADKVVYHDVWCGPGTLYGQADGIPLFMTPSETVSGIADTLGIKKGLICSGDKFISTAEEIKFIKSHFPDVKAVDMESASIAQTCFLNDIPFAIIRVVSDTPGGGENISQYQNFWENAPLKTFDILNTILESLN